jgi:hypothetical protein
MMAGVSKDTKMPRFERKHLLRATVRKAFPKELLKAPKKGFFPPLRSWINIQTVSKYAESNRLKQFGLSSHAFNMFTQLNGEGKRDFGHFLWMILLLLEHSNDSRKAHL